MTLPPFAALNQAGKVKCPHRFRHGSLDHHLRSHTCPDKIRAERRFELLDGLFTRAVSRRDLAHAQSHQLCD